MLLLLSVALFALALALPAVPALREILRPRDDGRLHIPEAYVRDPRWFGRAFKAKLAPFVASARGDDRYAADVQLRTTEDVRWAPVLALAPLERLRGIAIGERIHVGHGAAIRDAYALESLTCDRDVVARTLTCAGDLFVGDDVTVLRWIDADGAIEVGAGTSLGVSASAGGRVTLARNVVFERVWGSPVATLAGDETPCALVEHAHARRLDRAGTSDGEPVIVYGPLRIAAGTTVAGSIKVHGPLTVEPGVRIAGSVIARGDVTFAARVTVAGHVFSEADVRLGPGCRIGTPGGVKTAYAAGRMWLGPDVEVAGWVVAEDGGRTQ
jgi:predicted acyltransferase (DUF342 family)